MHLNCVIILTAAIFSQVQADKERVDDAPISPKNEKINLKYNNLEASPGQESVQKFAENLDTNKDGFVDQSELLEWVVKSYNNIDNHEALEKMSDLDIDGDGFVSWQEYVDDSFPDDLTNNPDDQKLLEQDKLYFDKADTNHDGKLDIKELQEFNTPENYENMHDVIVTVTLAEKDLNSDGAIDISEFLGDMAEQKGTEWYEIEKNRFYEEYDIDHDGKLTGNELRHWLLPDVNIIGSSEAEHLLANSDDDKDGKLSYEEVVNHHKLFANSDAATKGDHLHPYVHEEL